MKIKKIMALITSVLSASCFAADSEINDVVETVKNKAHWSGLPIWGDKVREMGYNLPVPIGVGIFTNSQEVEYIANNNFNINANGGILGGPNGSQSYIIPSEDVKITGKDQSIQLRLDAWIFPFLNIYGLAGYTEGSKDIDVYLTNATTDDGEPLDFLNKIQKPLTLNLDYKAYNVGGGAVLASQFSVNDDINPIIVTASGAITNSWTNMTDSTILTTVGSLRVGQRYTLPHGKLGFFAGYQYQSIQQQVSGSLSLEGTSLGVLAKEIDFDVELKSKETSNASVSFVYDFGREDKWRVFAEYGFLNWKQLTVSVGRRF